MTLLVALTAAGLTVAMAASEDKRRYRDSACLLANGWVKPSVRHRVAHAAAARQQPSGRALAAAFLSACNGTWTGRDTLMYFQSNWHPGRPTGASCGDMVRIGDPGDGGKMVCNPQALFAAAGALD